MKPLRSTTVAWVMLCMAQPVFAAVTVTVKNDLKIPRDSETVVLQWRELSAALGKVKPDHVVVQDSDGKPIVAQPIFFNGQKKGADELVFQADFLPDQTREFTIKPGLPEPYDPKVYGRWVPERDDDFAWENDRIAYRIYGPLLEKVEPGSSGVDVWPKRTRNLIVNKWYQMAQSINDGYYDIGNIQYVSVGGAKVASTISGNEFGDIPASFHNGAAGFSFSDGHSEIHKWQDPRTSGRPGQGINGLPVIYQDQGSIVDTRPFNDIHWAATHSSIAY